LGAFKGFWPRGLLSGDCGGVSFSQFCFGKGFIFLGALGIYTNLFEERFVFLETKGCFTRFFLGGGLLINTVGVTHGGV